MSRNDLDVKDKLGIVKRDTTRCPFVLYHSLLDTLNPLQDSDDFFQCPIAEQLVPESVVFPGEQENVISPAS